jgi:hypothetical protein
VKQMFLTRSQPFGPQRNFGMRCFCHGVFSFRLGVNVLKGPTRLHTRLVGNVCLTAYQSYINAWRASVVFARCVRTSLRPIARLKNAASLHFSPGKGTIKNRSGKAWREP